MKEKIIELRKEGFSYNKIAKILGCAKSTISYHCNNEGLQTPILRINDEIIENIKEDSKSLKNKEIVDKYNVSLSTVNSYSLPKYVQKKINKCVNCDEDAKNKYCSKKCSQEMCHKNAYDDYINNNEKYNRGNYTPKSFKDFFMYEQDNKCAICKNEPIWMGEKIVFVIDHIDGDASNNNRINIRMICPNCDSQTDTFKSKNKNSKRRNYWREKIIKDIKECKI